MNPHNTDQLTSLFDSLKKAQWRVASTTANERKAKLKALKKAVSETYRQEIRDALKADFGKPQAEVDLTEVYTIVNEINHTLSHLNKWMANEPVSTPITLIGSSSKIVYEPKGVCLIISPWNFPLNLTFCPLVSAVAAGNVVMLKPSEHTPNIAAVMQKIVGQVFASDEVIMVQGDASLSEKLLELPFNHIFFTGAPSIGKVVMAAAAKNLTSVTLELGGKSPTIIDETANMKNAIKRITWGKYMNAGQICISPDYIFIHKTKLEEFVAGVKQQVEQFYGTLPINSNDYTQIVNERHTSRVLSYIDDSVSKGAKVVMGGKFDLNKNGIEPTMVVNVDPKSDLLTKEIFGPVMPVVAYENIDEALNYINVGEKPLALYIYSTSDKSIDYIIKNTRAGGSCVNNNAIHFFNNNLPFGGSNNSGIGKSHGIFGFQAFSEARAVYRQHLPSILEILMPPYSSLKEKLINLTIKYF